MRLYTFTNMYLSSIQNGIQSAHVLGELLVKYNNPSENARAAMLQEWARDHKTMIVLNGGYSSVLRELANFFNQMENPYPWADFHEGQDALDGALTCVGIVLPANIYDRGVAASQMIQMIRPMNDTSYDRDMDEWHRFSFWERELITKLQDFSLAK